MHPPLTAFLVTYDNGDKQPVSMAAGVTLEQAKAHYVGTRFEITETTFRTGVKVEELDASPASPLNQESYAERHARWSR